MTGQQWLWRVAMRPAELEQAVFELEEVRIVVRATASADLGDYSYERKAAGSASISEWLEQRVKPCTDGFPVVVIDGSGALPHGRTKMSRLRASYERPD
jgi:hypothetical protein